MRVASGGLGLVLLLGCGGLFTPDPVPAEPIGTAPADGVRFPPVFLADGNLAVVATSDSGSELRVLSVPAFTEARPPVPLAGFPVSWAITPDARVMAWEVLGDEEWPLLVARDGAAPHVQLAVPSGESCLLALAPDGSLLAWSQPVIYTERGTVHVVDTTSGAEVASFELAAPLDGLTFTPDGGALLAVQDGGRIERWDPGTKQASKLVEFAPPSNGRSNAQFGGRHALAFSPTGQYLALATEYGGYQLIDLAAGASTGLSLGRFDWDPQRWVDPGAYSAGWSAETGSLYLHGGGAIVAGLDPATGKARALVTLPGVVTPLAGEQEAGLALSPDGGTVVVWMRGTLFALEAF